MASDPFGDNNPGFRETLARVRSMFAAKKAQVAEKVQTVEEQAEKIRVARAAAAQRRAQPFQENSTSKQASPYQAPYQPRPDTRLPLQLAIAILVAAIPITFYLLRPSVDVSQGVPKMGDRGNNVGVKAPSVAQRPAPVAAAGAAGGGATATESVQSALQDTALEHAAKHANPNYVCPMHPEIISSDPAATCPICGMHLVKLEPSGEAGVVKLAPNVVNSLGVRTEKAKIRTLYRRIDSVGYISVNENNLRTMSLRTDAWIETLHVKTEGERVSKGQLLFEVYSPDLVNAQEEYVHAQHNNNDLLASASYDRLIALGISELQIQELLQTGKVEKLVKIYAPQPGIVAKLGVREGQYAKPSQSLIEIVDLSSVWLMVDVFERQADWVEAGQRAEVNLPFMPGKSWEGEVEYIYPSLDANTRSLKVRLRFANPDEALKPNMYADVAIFAQPKRNVLSVPREALIRTGKQDRVIVAMGGGRFVPMAVKVGMETDSKVEILSGLGEGDEVVVSSQFLIDSESSFKASLSRMSGS